MTLDIEGQLWTVVEFQHVKPGKGPAFVRTKLKQVMTGKVVEKTFNAGVKVDIAILEKREMNFLYKEGDDFVFMDNVSFDQITISAATVGDASNYMLENTGAIVAIHESNPPLHRVTSIGRLEDHVHRARATRRSFIRRDEASNG